MAERDPRLDRLAKSLNDQLLGGTIRHGVYLERLKNSLVREVIAYLNDQVFPDVVAVLQGRLERLAGEPDVWTTKRYRDLLALVREILDNGVGQARDAFTGEMDKLAGHEAAWQKKAVDTASAHFDVGFDLPSPEILKQIVRDQPFAGGPLKDWFEKLNTNTADRVVQQVNLGLAQGETVDQMVQRVRGTKALAYSDGVLDISRREAESIVRTAATHVTARAREATFQENSDIVKGVMWDATLDDITCPICGRLDGQVFESGKGPRPPAHPNCRCSPTPVLKSWEELGIPLREIPAATRASATGEVPETVTYEDWLADQDEETQQDVLGVTRAKLFRSGELELKQFSNDRGQLLTLDQLAKKEGVTVPDRYRPAGRAMLSQAEEFGAGSDRFQAGWKARERGERKRSPQGLRGLQRAAWLAGWDAGGEFA